MTTIFGIFIGILILSLMMFIHEMGHFLVGKKLGFTIIEFSIFMGPRILSWERKGIRYSLKLIPLGASVQFAGEYNGDPKGLEEAKKKGYVPQAGDFYARPAWQRICVAFAGPIFNVVTALLAFTLFFSIWGMQEPVIEQIQPASAAQSIFKAQDKILSINGQAVYTGLDIQSSLLRHQDGPIHFEWLRDQSKMEAELSLQKKDKYILGIHLDPLPEGILINEVHRNDFEGLKENQVLRPKDILLKLDGQKITYEALKTKLSTIQDSQKPSLNLTVLRDQKTMEVTVSLLVKKVQEPLGIVWQKDYNQLNAFPYAIRNSWSVVRLTFGAIGDLIVGRAKPQETLSGPIGLVSTISGAVTAKHFDLGERLSSLLMMFALVSLSLGIMNLLPIPPLDGSLILMSTLEWIRGKALSSKVQSVITIIGLLMIASLFILGFYADLKRLLF